MNLDNLTKQQLVEEAKTNVLAFGLLYKRYVKKLYNYFYYKTFESREAEDLTSHTFEKVLKHLQTFKKDTNFQAWIFRIAHNILVDYYRKKKPQIEIDTITIGYEENYLQLLENKEQQVLLQAELVKLSVIEQEVLHLHYQQGLSNKEIGVVIKKSEGAVKQIAFRAIAKLKERMKEE